jgi:hypothetical protein
MQIVAWIIVGCGLFVLTEGYHAIRQRAAQRSQNRWWLAGLIVVAGVGLVRLGLELAG